MSKLALKLIAENLKTRSPILDLGNCGLTRIPEELAELVWLEELSFASFRQELIEGKRVFHETENNQPKNTLSSLNTKAAVFSKLTSLKNLFLNGEIGRKFKLEDVSPLANLSALQWLDISYTQVSDLNPLTHLSALQQLDVYWANVSDLSPLRHLSALQQLDVSYSQVIDLSPLRHLSALQQLKLYDNVVVDLSPLTHLSALQQLDISINEVSDLSPLRHLSALQQLKLFGTDVVDLSPLRQLSALQQLDVSYSQVIDLNPLRHLSALQQLDVSGTQVSDLSPLLKHITTGLEVKYSGEDPGSNDINVFNCPLTNPPAEIVKQGNAAILNYFSEQQAQGVDHLYEAKLLLIGEGGAGKTSLMRRLYQTDKALPEEKDSTKGIDIHRHEFKLQNGRDFRLNVWDFGGQEIYHATHQFFLTKRSLYVLLDDTRNNYKSVHDHGFKYWLEVVDLLGEHSPVLIFQNEKSGRSKHIDKPGIKGKFANVKEFYQGNLEASHAADEIREAIQYFVQQLPHIGEELPAKWVPIRADIEALSKQHTYISLQSYFDIYSKHLEFDRDKAMYLSSYLHDLGVLLHFQDDALLARTVILQNQWATEAVFKILDDETVKAKLGHFDTNDCQRLWQDSEYADMHLELLTLMQKFELCYQLPDQPGTNWLAPQLLSPSKPETLTDWAEPGDLVLRYLYEFLPKGIISRLIVRTHRFIRQTQLCWSSGVLFEHNEANLLAEIPEKGGEIVLRARGTEAKALLSVIAADLDALNETFHGLAEFVKKLVPCNCSHCAELTDPEFFEQQRLLQRKKDDKLTLECPASYMEVHVLTLLDGISVEKLPGWAANEETEKTASAKFENTQRTIKIFLASSEELKDERDQFDLYFRQQNDILRNIGIYLKVVRWENFLDAMSSTRLQDAYNKQVCQCDIFVSLFFTKTGKYTEEEFDTAHQQFQSSEKPLIYTFFKNDDIKIDNVSQQDLKSLWAFQEKLDSLGHFYTKYTSIEDLKLKFKDQLEKLLEQGW